MGVASDDAVDAVGAAAPIIGLLLWPIAATAVIAKKNGITVRKYLISY
jgi:hypothetical protein